MGVKWPVDDGREFIMCEWFILLPSDADEWFPPRSDEDPPPSDVIIDCCWCWLSSWSRGGEIGSAFILTGAGEEEEGGGVLFETAKWGIPLERGKKTSQHLLNIDDTNYLVCCSDPKFWCDEFHDVIMFKSDEDIEKSCAANVLTG